MSNTGRIGRNLASVAFAHVAAQGLAFVVSLAITRNLGVEPYGVFVFGFAFPTWFTLFISLGLDYVVTIDVAADRRKAGVYLSTVALVRIPLVLLAIGTVWIALQFLVVDPFDRMVVFILAIANILSSYNGTFDAQFRAHERFDYSAAVTVLERSVAAGMVLLLLALGHGLLAVAGSYLCAVLVAMALNLILLRRRSVWFSASLDLSVSRHILVRATPFALAALVSALMYSTAPILLTFLGGPISTGHFNAAFVLLIALMAPLQMYNLVFLPRMSRMYRESPTTLPALLARTQRLFFALGLPIAVGGALFAESLIVGLYGDAFAASAAVFAVLSFVLPVTTASLGAGTALGATDRAYLDLRFSALGAAANVVLCLLLIPSMGPVGAAWAFLAASTVIAALRLVATHRLIGPFHVLKTTASPAMASGTMALTLLPLSGLPFGAAVVLGAVVYFAALILFRGVTRDDFSLIADMVRGILVNPSRQS